MRNLGLASALTLALLLTAGRAQEDPGLEFLRFVRVQAAALRAQDRPPVTAEDWTAQRLRLRRRLLEAWGGFPGRKCPLAPRKLGELHRDGYRVEKLVFQTMPGVWMTANAYVPDRPGKLPAVLAVHGHWRGAKQDPVVQARNIGLAKHGFFVLAVDAFGAGERGLGMALGEYHGEMVGATLLPVGRPLSGLQVYENLRAVDYLHTRPEVDAKRIGITGASGGGNQTMYAAAWDDRLRAAVPVCSVGTYQVYLGVACCMCEVVPGALTFTEESGLLALAAPRGLMVISATRDGVQFSVPEAKKSIAGAQPVFDLLKVPGHLKHAVFESGHDYNREMREAMYGWFTRHLKGSESDAPLADPTMTTEDPEALRCYPGTSRPADWVTLPQFAAAEGRRLLAERRKQQFSTRRMRSALTKVLGGFPRPTPLDAHMTTVDGIPRRLAFAPEPGLTLSARLDLQSQPAPIALLLDLESTERAATGDLARQLRRNGWSVVVPELRATGRLAYRNDRIGRAPDHNTAEWALWIGRPLLGQWVWDVRRTLDALAEKLGTLPKDLAVIGEGPAGLIALCAAALDDRIRSVAASGTMASFVTDRPYENQRLGTLVPGLLREVGDVAELAALVAPKRCVIAEGVRGDGARLSPAELDAAFASARRAFETSKATDRLAVTSSTDPGEIVPRLR